MWRTGSLVPREICPDQTNHLIRQVHNTAGHCLKTRSRFVTCSTKPFCLLSVSNAAPFCQLSVLYVLGVLLGRMAPIHNLQM